MTVHREGTIFTNETSITFRLLNAEWAQSCIQSYPFECWETVWSVLCQFKQYNTNKKYWAEIWTKLLVKQKHISKYWSVIFCLLRLLPDVFVSTMWILMFINLWQIKSYINYWYKNKKISNRSKLLARQWTVSNLGCKVG